MLSAHYDWAGKHQANSDQNAGPSKSGHSISNVFSIPAFLTPSDPGLSGNPQSRLASATRGQLFSSNMTFERIRELSASILTHPMLVVVSDAGLKPDGTVESAISI